MIFNIQKCSIHDGEGLRTLVFLKGCPLRCPWCSNPESQLYGKEIMENQSRCIGCGCCINDCPNTAIGVDGKIDRSKCPPDCNKCTDICYAEAKRIVGREYEIDELYKEIAKDRIFYEQFGGGVTFSGGEPLTHGKYLAQIAKKCRENRIDVAIESCGYGVYEEFKEALPYINSMMMDIKHIDSDIHKKITGVPNELILENIRKISEFGIPITIRTPIIPGYTNDPENIRGIAEFINTLPSVTEYEILAYHSFGESKYAALGREYELKGVEPPSEDEMNALAKIANEVLAEKNKICFWIKDNTRQGV